MTALNASKTHLNQSSGRRRTKGIRYYPNLFKQGVKETMSRLLSDEGSVKMSKHRLKRIAYHEAGHAVAYYLWKERFKYVEIYNNPRKLLGSYPGALKEAIGRGGLTAPTNNGRMRIIKVILIGLAGGVAESIKDKRTKPLYNCILDLNRFKQLKIPYVGDKEFFDFLCGEIQRIMMEDEIWYAVTVLANQLLIHKRIPYKKAIRIIGDSIKEYGSERR